MATELFSRSRRKSALVVSAHIDLSINEDGKSCVDIRVMRMHKHKKAEWSSTHLDELNDKILKCLVPPPVRAT